MITTEKYISFKIVVSDDIYQIKKEFDKHNKHLYIVGGAVRDLYQGIIPHDIDLVTDAMPEESMNILKGKFNVSNEQGKAFGVLRIYTKDEPLGYELATFRRDISGGRNTKGDDQKVEIGSHITISDDVKRRDLTQNALFYDIEKEEIVDLVGGIYDINNNIISAVGEASERFIEDRLRILRTIRFASRNLSKISTDTSCAILNDNRLRGISSIDDVSQERIIEEFEKSVQWSLNNKKYDSLNYYFELLERYNMFDEMFPDLKLNINGIKSFNLIVIFAMLFRDNNVELLKQKLYELKVPSKYADPACFLLTLKRDLKDFNKILNLYKDKIRFHVTEQTMIEFAKLCSFNSKLFEAFLKFKPTVDAFALMNTGLKGAELGAKIKNLEIENFKNLI